MNDALSGRIVVVTGASRGIGAAVALAAAREGADVAVCYHERQAQADGVVESIRSLGREARTFAADLSDPIQARALIKEAEAHFGRIDGLVNNAGIMPESPFLEIDDDEWDRVIRTDLYSAFACSQAALPRMVERGKGAIVMTSSRLGQIGWPQLAHYSAAKAALLGLVKSLAREFGPKGIRVNAVAPGVTVTDMTSSLIGDEAGRKRLAELPAGRFGTPEEVALTVVFLLSDSASLYHGQTLGPNGGGFMP
jgi:3-oxoacyl-[acyl-carrier protein] reductase